MLQKAHSSNARKPACVGSLNHQFLQITLHQTCPTGICSCRLYHLSVGIIAERTPPLCIEATADQG